MQVASFVFVHLKPSLSQEHTTLLFLLCSKSPNAPSTPGGVWLLLVGGICARGCALNVVVGAVAACRSRGRGGVPFAQKQGNPRGPRNGDGGFPPDPP